MFEGSFPGVYSVDDTPPKHPDDYTLPLIIIPRVTEFEEAFF